MDQREKLGRFEAAAAILDVLKQQGCPMAAAAKELTISPTTVSHWRAVPSAHKRSVPIPSDIQLRGLLGLLMRRVAGNLYALNTLLSGGYIGGEELLKLLVLLTAQINDTQKRCAKQLAIMQQYGSLRSKTKGPTPTTELDPVLFLLNAYSSSEWGPSSSLPNMATMRQARSSQNCCEPRRCRSRSDSPTFGIVRTRRRTEYARCSRPGPHRT